MKQLRGSHVEAWVAGLNAVKSPGTRMLYKGMPVAVLNWAVSKVDMDSFASLLG